MSWTDDDGVTHGDDGESVLYTACGRSIGSARESFRRDDPFRTVTCLWCAGGRQSPGNGLFSILEDYMPRRR